MRDNLRMDHRLPERDKPWMMRTYAGHSTAARSNVLYRGNLAKGQTGLSIAFDLPTQTGYDADHQLARSEVGKVGVPVAHKGDMHALLDGIPLDRMNTSMTINATAAWLLALYIVAAEENGIAPSVLQGTTQNDIIKEYLSRGTYAFPPAPSMRLIADMVAYTVEEVPRWNPVNICSYHLQEAGATPVQEIAYAMSTAIAVLDEVSERVGSDAVRMCFDVGHAHIVGALETIDEAAPAVALFHLHDNFGDREHGSAPATVDPLRLDLHLPPGTGTVPWEAVAPVLLGHDAPLQLEVHPPHRPDAPGLATVTAQLLGGAGEESVNGCCGA